MTKDDAIILLRDALTSLLDATAPFVGEHHPQRTIAQKTLWADRKWAGDVLQSIEHGLQDHRD